MVKIENFSEELKKTFHFMEEYLLKEMPTTVLNTDYFVMAILTEKDSYAYNFLAENLSETILEEITKSYTDILRTKARPAMKPGTEPRYDAKFTHHIEDADGLRMLFRSNEITTEHILLSIIRSVDEDNNAGKVFRKAGITSTIMMNKLKDKMNESSAGGFVPEEKMQPQGKVPMRPTGNGPDKNFSFSFSLNVPKNESAPAIINSLFHGNGVGIGAPGEPMPGEEEFGDEEEDFEEETTGKKRQPSALSLYCNNLNKQALSGNIDRIVGRENETQEIIRTLSRRKKNNIVLVGQEGVGKTAIAENLALRIVEGNVPDILLDKRIFSLDMSALIAGTTLRGMFEARVKAIIKESVTAGDVILFIDNIGAVLADKGKNDYDLSAMLSRALENGDVQVVGTSDFKSYRTTFDKDPSLARRFQKIIIEAPSVEETKVILNNIKVNYETYHGVKFADGVVDACVEAAERYITDRNLPDSAVDILDESAAAVSVANISNSSLKELYNQLREKRTKLVEAKKNNAKDDIITLAKDEQRILKAIKREKKDTKPVETESIIEVTVEDILNTVANKTGIPTTNLTGDDKQNLLTMEERIKSEVIGQDDAIETICRALKRGRIGLHRGRCMFSAILIGKTGTGKTLIAKKLAKELFGSEKALIRFDMSEYSEKTAVNKLIGASAGYAGFEEGGQLTEAIKNKKHCVLLLDEIEKADPEIYNIFLQVLDEGFLTDNSGMKVDFKNVVVLFTSNVGAKAVNDFGKGIGFNEDEDSNSKRIFNKELSKRFPPEFINRIDSTIYVKTLTDEDLHEIIKLELEKLRKNIADINYDCKFDDSVVDFIFDIVKEDKQYGARPILRAIQDNIENSLTDELLEHDYEPGHMFNISCFSGSVKIA